MQQVYSNRDGMQQALDPYPPAEHVADIHDSLEISKRKATKQQKGAGAGARRREAKRVEVAERVRRARAAEQE